MGINEEVEKLDEKMSDTQVSMNDERPKPTKQALIELCGGNQGLIGSLHHGLYEADLSNFYPHLDLDELVAFAASSWKSRENDIYSFSDFVKSFDAYEIFNKVFEIGLPWLNKHKKISQELILKYGRLNPFKGKDLKKRLEGISIENVEHLKKELQEGINKYVFECQYQDAKMKQHGENIGIKIMEFQPVYPNKETTVPNFAAEIARIISHYPQGYKHLEKPQLPLP